MGVLFHQSVDPRQGCACRDAIDAGLFRRLPQRWLAISGVLRDVAAGMEYMHANRICHSDLNPANILLKVRGGFTTCSDLALEVHTVMLAEVSTRLYAALFVALWCTCLTCADVAPLR